MLLFNGRVRKELQARVYFNTSNVTIQPEFLKLGYLL